MMSDSTKFLSLEFLLKVQFHQLTTAQEKEFESFLKKNPEHKPVIAGMKMIIRERKLKTLEMARKYFDAQSTMPASMARPDTIEQEDASDEKRSRMKALQAASHKNRR